MWESFIPDIEELENIAKQVMPNIVLVEERGLADGTHCSIDEGHNPILHWDSLMYEFYEKELTLLDTFPYDEDDEKLLTEMGHNYIGVLLDHLSEKNKKDVRICSALRKKANEFMYPYFAYIHDKLPQVSEWVVQYYIQTGVVKLLILYHEVAHGLFSMDESIKNQWQGNVLTNIKSVCRCFNIFSLGLEDKKKKREVKNVLKKLSSGDKEYNALLEELSADTYALAKTYATMHLNIKSIDRETLSDNVMLGYLRYIDISSQYGYLVNYWRELYGWCISKKKKHDTDDADKIWRKSIFNSIRCDIWGLVSIIGVIQSDIETWSYNPPKGITFSDPRLKRIIHQISINGKTLSSMTTASINPQLFNSIVEDANRLFDEKEVILFEYPIIPPNAMVISWLSVQYHNCSGLNAFELNDYDEALKEYRIAVAISEQYLGHNHKLTARGYNNICSCYLGKVKTMLKEVNEENAYALEEYMELATFHSSVAQNILVATQKTMDMQAGAIYQNAGEICMLQHQYELAVECYLKAQRVKEKNPYGYDEKSANTDFSLSLAYFQLKRFLDAKRICKKALDYYRSSRNDGDARLKEVEDFYNQIQYMMSPSGGAMNSIIASMMRGEKVNLDQYNDWSEFFGDLKSDEK